MSKIARRGLLSVPVTWFCHRNGLGDCIFYGFVFCHRYNGINYNGSSDVIAEHGRLHSFGNDAD